MNLNSPLLELAKQAQGPLLALDASTMTGSLCIVDLVPGEVRELTLEKSATPSEALVLALAQALGPTGATRLAGIVVGLGPGSFTGLRVALATIKGLAFGANVSVYGVSSLALLAAHAGPGRVATVLDARRGDVFAAVYDVMSDGSVNTVLDDCVMTPQTLVPELTRLAPVTVVGCGSAAYPTLAAAQFIEEPRARAAAGLLMCKERIIARAADDIMALVPRYLRVSEAERQAKL